MKQRQAGDAPAPAEIERRLDKALACLEAGEPTGAERRLDALVRLVPDHPEVRHALGYVLCRAGRTDDAVGHLRHAVAIRPADPAYHNSLGIALTEAGRPDEAAPILRRAVDLAPDRPNYLFNLANALKDSGADGEAVDCYRRVSTALPDDPEVLNNLGVALTRDGQPAAAVETFRRALAIRPDAARISYNLGVAQREAGDFEPALAAFRDCLALDDGQVDAYWAMARLHADSGELPQAIASLRQVVELRPDDVAAMRELAALYRRTRRFAEARVWIERIDESVPDDPEAALLLADILAEENDVDAAVAAYRRLLARDHGNLDALLKFGYFLIMLQRLEEAESCVLRARALGPGNAKLLFLESLFAEARGDLAGACRFQDESLRIDPNNLEMQNRRGQLHLACGELEPGFRLNDSRIHLLPGGISDLPAPPWEGQPLVGKSLVICAEQGVGDEIIFGSCISDVIRAARQCYIECDPRFVPLFRRSFPQAIVHPSHKSADNRFNVRTYGWLADYETPDYAVPAGSLPRYLRKQLADFPAAGGYLAVDPERLAYWRRRLDALGPGLKVGLCWRSSVKSAERDGFYTTIDDWAPIFTEPGVVPVNLQYDDCAAELDHARAAYGVELHGWPELDLYNDFDNIAAMMLALDVVVSASTIMPVLAAAVGQRALMVAVGRHWSLLGTDRYPWLPDLKPFIRPPGEDRAVVIDRILREVRALEAERMAAHAACG